MIIIGISGKARMGKSTLARILFEKVSAKGANTIQAPIASVIKTAVPMSPGETKEQWRKELIAYGARVRAEEGEDYFVRELVRRNLCECLIIEDLRLLSEYNWLENYRFAEFLPVRIQVPLLTWKGRFAHGEYDAYNVSSAGDKTETDLDKIPASQWSHVFRNGRTEDYLESLASMFLAREGL